MIKEAVQAKNRKVTTYGHDGNVNGWLMELYKDGDKTLAYLTASKPGAFKGYHLHRKRAARYVCVKGKVKVILYLPGGNHCVFTEQWNRQEYILSPQDTLYIPTGVPTGLETIGDEEALIINWPNPAYDPRLKDEQVEYTEEELEKGIVK